MTIPAEAELKRLANEDATLSTYTVSVLYGDHGKRKTVTACSMVKERGLLLTSDDSWKTLKKPIHKEELDKVKPVKLTGLSQLEHIDFDGYDTIIWDTFSASVDMYIDMLYDEASWIGKNYREKITSTNKELEKVAILSPMDYRVTRDIFRPALGRFFQLPANLIFTSQWNEPMKGLSPDMTRKPGIPNATFKIIATRADIIACLRPENSKSFVADVTENSVAYLGKSRIEGIEGKMPLDTFVENYKKVTF